MMLQSMNSIPSPMLFTCLARDALRLAIRTRHPAACSDAAICRPTKPEPPKMVTRFRVLGGGLGLGWDIISPCFMSELVHINGLKSAGLINKNINIINREGCSCFSPVR